MATPYERTFDKRYRSAKEHLAGVKAARDLRRERIAAHLAATQPRLDHDGKDQTPVRPA